MTAPGRGADGVRGRIAAALPHADWCHEDLDCCGCDCEPYRPLMADLLLPVVEEIRREAMAAVLKAAAQEQRNEADNVPDTDEGTHADGHSCAAEFLDRRAAVLRGAAGDPSSASPSSDGIRTPLDTDRTAQGE